MRPAAPSRSIRPRAGAFTLVELLVSIVVLTLLVFALFNILNASAASWSRNEQLTDGVREVRAAIDLMSRDFQSMAFDGSKPSDPAAYQALPAASKIDVVFLGKDGVFTGLAGSDPPDPSAQDPAPPANPIDFTLPDGAALPSAGHGDAVFFLARLPTNAQQPATPTTAPVAAQSDICTVGYYLAYTPDPSGRKSFKLYRHLESGQQTYTRLTGPKTIKATPANPANDEVLASNVIDFKLKFYRYDAASIKYVERTPWPTRVFADPVTTGGPATTTLVPAAPVVIDVELTSLSSTAASALSEPKDWEGTGKLSRLAANQKQTFKFRVYVRR